MLQLSLLEQFQILIKLILGNPFFIFLLIFSMIVAVVLMDTTNFSYKKNKKIYLVIYALVAIAIIIRYNTALFTMVDYLLDNLFMIFYFPSLAIQTLMIIIMNIALLITVFNKSIDVSYKRINVTFYCIMMYILFLTLDSVVKNGIDVYSQLSIYSNSETVALVQINSLLFILWAGALLVNLIAIKLSKDPNITHKKEKIVEKVIAKDDNIIAKEEDKNNDDEYINVRFTKEEYLLMLKILRENKKD